MYSGYVPISNGTAAFHYLYQEAEVEPETAPLVLWMNGGPGCTSLKGAFEELGPLVFNRYSFDGNGSAPPRLFYNPSGWTQVANMLYFESPAGVGFSRCAGTSLQL